MLVDDHDVVRTGLRSFLQSQGGFQVIAEARTGEEAVQRAMQYQPDIILMVRLYGEKASRGQEKACN